MTQSTTFRITGRLATASTLVLCANPNGGTPYDEAILKLAQDRTLYLCDETRWGGDGTLPDEWHRLTRTWVIARGPSELNVAELRADLAPGGRLHDLMTRLAEGLDREWDGQNMVGALTDDANEAEDELHCHFAEHAYRTRREVWDANEWFNCEFQEVSADMDDDALKALAEAFELGARRNGVVLVNTLKVLERHRGELRDGL